MARPVDACRAAGGRSECDAVLASSEQHRRQTGRDGGKLDVGERGRVCVVCYILCGGGCVVAEAGTLRRAEQSRAREREERQKKDSLDLFLRCLFLVSLYRMSAKNGSTLSGRGGRLFLRDPASLMTSKSRMVDLAGPPAQARDTPVHAFGTRCGRVGSAQMQAHSHATAGS